MLVYKINDLLAVYSKGTKIPILRGVYESLNAPVDEEDRVLKEYYSTGVVVVDSSW